MKPTHKSYSLDAAITAFTGVDRKASITANQCVFCNKMIDPDTEFRDELSRREFQISGICQECQDKTFGA